MAIGNTLAMSGYRPGVLLDLDGTLVDSVYQHVAAWGEALRLHGYDVPLWRVHHGIGMGGERLLPWLLGRHVDDADALSAEHTKRFLSRTDQLVATEGALALLDDLEEREIPYIVATSAESEVMEALLQTLGRTDLPTATADDVGSPKPAPDLLLATCAEIGIEPSAATLVGDSIWDAEAARRVGIRCVGVRTGGFGDEMLLAAGAIDVVADPKALIGRL